MIKPPPDISLIVPLLNEADQLPDLFACLAAQEGVPFEVILCDGGSSDGSQQLCRQLGDSAPFAVHSIGTPRGRGRQMNAGAVSARSDLLLFLHADSRFSSPDALRVAVSTGRQMLLGAADPLAARFRLHFRRQDSRPSLAYCFYEGRRRPRKRGRGRG